MGLVFASRRTGIEPDHLGFIFTEDGFRQLDSEFQAEVGDVVVYKGPFGSHVAIIVEIEDNLACGSRKLRVLSKWGRYGEYLHPINDVPDMLGKPSEYWTERT